MQLVRLQVASDHTEVAEKLLYQRNCLPSLKYTAEEWALSTSIRPRHKWEQRALARLLSSLSAHPRAGAGGAEHATNGAGRERIPRGGAGKPHLNHNELLSALLRDLHKGLNRHVLPWREHTYRQPLLIRLGAACSGGVAHARSGT